jgi:CBS-domain-containing membrane protein
MISFFSEAFFPTTYRISSRLQVLIRVPPSKPDFLGVVSDRRALAWFASHAEHDPAFMRYLSNPLTSLALPSLYLYYSVVAVTLASSALDAMTLMSDEGVSSVAVIDEEHGNLLSAISVADIAKVILPQPELNSMNISPI